MDLSRTSPASGKTLLLFNVFLAQTYGLVFLGAVSAIKHQPLWQVFPVGLPGLLVWTIVAGLPILSIVVVRQLSHLSQAEISLREMEKFAVIGRLSATLAHEVRNPVVVIKGYLKLADQLLSQVKSLRHPILVEAVANASHEVAHMENLLSDFLVFGKPSDDEYDLVEIEALLREVTEGVGQMAAARQVRVSVDLSDPLPRIRASRKRLHQVMANLLSNAVESCPQDGSVRVGAAFPPDEHGIMLTVADTGAGIPPENLPKIFDPFFTTKEMGTGLGLSVVKKIVDDCGGSIGVRSEPGKGTEFTVRLPVQAD